MVQPNHERPLRVAGVLAGDDLPVQDLTEWLRTADLILAADGGADRVLAADARPDHLVGDMDSASRDALQKSRNVLRDNDASRTDCDKMIALAMQLTTQRLTVFGLDGDLLDHMLASLFSLAAAPMIVQLVLRRQFGAFIRPGAPLSIAVQPGDRIAMLPLESEVKGVFLTGVTWPLQGEVLDPFGLISVSNRAERDEVSATVESGTALLLWERRAFAGDPWTQIE